MAAPAAQANAAAGSGVEPMMEDALNDLLVFPDISDSIQKEFTIDGRPKSPRDSRPPGPSRRRSSMDRSIDRRRKERNHIRRSEDGSGSSQENSSGYSSPSQASSAFQEVTRKQRKEKSAARPFLTDQTELPGDFKKREDGQIEYWDEGGDLCLFKQPRAPTWNPRLQSAALHPSGHIFITESLANPQDLPKPSARMPFGLVNNYKMVFRPKAKCFIHDYDDQCDCLAVVLRDTFHRQSVVPLFCTKRTRLSQAELEVKIPEGVERYQENPSRIFVYCDSLRTHVLGIPSPFAVSVKWASKVFKPAYASCHSRRQARLFYSLFDSQSYRDTAKTYLKSPEHWLPESHPYYSEPREGTELYHCSADLYGLETMFRTSLVQHPCKNRETFVYICSDRYLRTPVLPDEGEKFSLDNFVTEKTMPFFAQGMGTVLCPICLYSSTSASEVMLPAFFGRKAFVQHYRELHWDHSIASGLSSPTQLGTRIYQAHLVYTLCIAHLCLSGAMEDNVNGHPFLSLAGVRFSTHLRKVLVAPTIPMEDQDSEEYCEVTALAEEMMRPSGSHHE
jgi:hypothetical protein